MNIFGSVVGITLRKLTEHPLSGTSLFPPRLPRLRGCYGGGAGGAIRIDVGTLAGAGSVHADGGNAVASNAGGGGGGRVAVFYDDADDFELGNLTAAGGTGLSAGAAGSVVVDGP